MQKIKTFLRYFDRKFHRFYLVISSFIMATIVGISLFKIHQNYNNSNHNTRNSLYSSIFPDNTKQVRAPASSEISYCNTQEIDPYHLRQRINQLEKQFSQTNNLKGKWYGLKLSELPAPQARLLATFGHMLGDQRRSVQYDSCKDIICVLNQIYDSEDKTLGYLVYYIYLKSGIFISTSNWIPGQKSNYPGVYNEDKISLQHYLFSKEQLVKIYHTVNALPDHFYFNPLLRSIHKIPKEYLVDEFTKTQECIASRSNGHILISDKCFDENFDHRFTKQIAFFYYYFNQFDHQQTDLIAKWQELSLWKNEYYFDSKEKKYSITWHKEEQKGQNPHDQLMSLTTDIILNDSTSYLNLSKNKEQFITHHMLNDKRFDADGIYKILYEQIQNTWPTHETKLWAKCINENKVAINELKSPTRSLASTLDNEIFQCVQAGLPEFKKIALENLLQNNTFACRYFNNDLYTNSKNKLLNHFDHFLKERVTQRKLEIIKSKNKGIDIQLLRNQFVTNFNPVVQYLTCHAENDAQKCYEKKTKDFLNKKILSKQDLNPDESKLLLDDIITIYPFAFIKEQTQEKTKQLLRPLLIATDLKAKRLWFNCLENNNHIEGLYPNPPHYFLGNKYFVGTEILNCINENFEESIDNVINEQNDKKYIALYEKSYLKQFIRPYFLQSLRIKQEQDTIKEQNEIIAHFYRKRGNMIHKLKQQKSFFNELYSFQQLENRCLSYITQFYPEVRFTTKGELDNSQGRIICQEFLGDEQTKLAKVEISKNWSNVSSKMKVFNANTLELHSKVCQRIYPLNIKGYDQMKNERLNKECLNKAKAFAYRETLDYWEEDSSFQYQNKNFRDIASELQK